MILFFCAVQRFARYKLVGPFAPHNCWGYLLLPWIFCCSELVLKYPQKMHLETIVRRSLTTLFLMFEAIFCLARKPSVPKLPPGTKPIHSGKFFGNWSLHECTRVCALPRIQEDIWEEVFPEYFANLLGEFIWCKNMPRLYSHRANTGNIPGELFMYLFRARGYYITAPCFWQLTPKASNWRLAILPI